MKEAQNEAIENIAAQQKQLCNNSTEQYQAMTSEENLTWTSITNDPVYQEWMETLKPSTELGYRSGILAFCRFYKIKPSDMRGWNSTTANDRLKQFVLYLKRNAKPYHGKRRVSSRPHRRVYSSHSI
jgi:hypothetical protein